MKKILINLTTFSDRGIHILWLLKFQKFQEAGMELYAHGGFFVKKLEEIKDAYDYRGLADQQAKIKPVKWTKIKFIFLSLKRNFLSLFSIRRVLKRKYDILYSPSAVLDLVIFFYILKLFNKKINWVAVFDNIVPITDPGNKITRLLAWLFFRMSLIMLRKADLIFVSTPDLITFLEKEKFPKNKLVLTGFGIEKEILLRARENPDLRIDALFTGRINETKGIYDMLEVLKIVKKNYPDFQLAILGDGDIVTKRQFKRKIGEMGLEKNVQFLGFRSGPDKFSVIKSAKCFWFLSVSPSESFGISLMEAVCSGLPAFVYNLEPFKNIYRNNEIYMFKKHDVLAVAEKVMEIFRENKLENKNGRLLIDKYAWERIIQIEVQALKKL